MPVDHADSIAELSALVERLSQLWLSATVAGAPERAESPAVVAGRPLTAWLAELWPGTAAWSGLLVDEELAARHLAGVAQERRRQMAELERIRAGLDRAHNRLGLKRQSADQRLEAFALVMDKAEAEVIRQRKLVQDMAAEARHWRKRASGLGRWLQGLSPVGRNRLRDAAGRLVEWERVRQIEAGRRQAEARQKALEEKAHLLGLELKEALTHRLEAARNLAAAQAIDRETTRAISLAQAKLRAALAALESRKAALAEAVMAEKQARKLELACRQVGQLAASLVERSLKAAVLPDADPLPELLEAMERIRAHEQRRRRLERVLLALDARQVRLGRESAEALKQVRRVNRQIESMELRLPALVAVLSGPQATDETIRAQTAAELSVLLAALTDLAPEATVVQHEVNRLRLAMEEGLERARILLDAWRDAVKDCRQAVNTAGQGLERVRLFADDQRKAAQAMIDGCRPVLAALGGLRHARLAQALGRAVALVGQTRQRAEDALAAANQAEANLRQTPFVALNKPPMAVKPHNLPLRRISGRNVQAQRLEALDKAASRWRQLAEGGLTQAINRPLREVAMQLSGSLGLLSRDHGRLREHLAVSRREAALLRLGLDQSQQRGERLRHNIARLRAVARGQRQTIVDQRAELAVAARSLERAAVVARRLIQATGEIENLSATLERSQIMAAALRGKALERHHRLRQARADLAAALGHVEISRRQQMELETARKALDRAQVRLHSSRQRLDRALAERDELRRQLAAQETAVATEDLRDAQVNSIQVELAAAKEEAQRWASLAGDMVLAMGLGQRRNNELERQVQDLAGQAMELRQRLGQLSLLMAMGAMGPAPAMSTSQMERLLERLQQARRRLGKAGRNALGQMILIGGLVSGLVLFSASNPSKATLRGPEPITVSNIEDEPEQTTAEAAPAEAAPETTASGPQPVPLYKADHEMTVEERGLLRRLAREAGTTPRALRLSAREAYPDKDVVDAADLEQLIRSCRVIAKRHPLIFQELNNHGLPASAPDLAALTPAPEKDRDLFLDRMYREYRDLGFSAEQAINALTQNDRAIAQMRKQWQPTQWFIGQVKPLPEVEALGLEQFVDSMAPYISDRVRAILRQKSLPISGDLNLYSRNLAFDIYCAARQFQVPVTFMLAIGHQETWYANILGDNDMSASPFQIYQPTKYRIIKDMADAGLTAPPKSIDLQENLSMAVFMAAFHLRDLMQQAYAPASGNRPAIIDMDRVMKSYNGSSSYAGKVAGRQGELADYLGRTL